ncbi:hypothetical protein CAPTEDRAFT_200462 [Capitella teleta]|uniref:Heat shock factor 2-binding protein n=1 Tax=Capitella teleta TaxID=283909 RepID=R7UJ72_CAPTE|nr:hypothetical protein CAPTEDRAFT_200462 [Capitella teleta]|eukprot:ELU06255.1 hypothetical protein CAPTEDRAFT_200462 [Capitella teleta]
MAAETQNLENVRKMLAIVKQNFSLLENDVDELKQLSHSGTLDPSFCIVKKADVEKIRRETNLMKKMIPRILQDGIACQQANLSTQRDLQLAQCQNENNFQEIQQWKESYESMIAERDQHRQECLHLQKDLNETAQELTQQSEYCASMGAACATLLWRVSRCEESIQAILSGSKVEQFLALVSSTLLSYVTACATKTDPANAPSDPEDLSEETHFVLALSGVVTNIAASSFGRNFLMSNEHGKHLVDAYLKILAEAPDDECADLKILLLMCLYNISINMKGLKYLQSQPDIISLMTWMVRESKRNEVRQHSLRIIQSLLSDENCANSLLKQAAVLLDDNLMK